MNKTALVFPGLGYHPDKPLLYYAKKLAQEFGYRVIEVRYGGFAYGVKDNAQKMREAFESALVQSEEILRGQGIHAKDQLLFISKSIGTAVAAAYQKRYGFDAHNLYFTPVEETFRFAKEGSGIAFHGTADSWVETEVVKQCCHRLQIPLYITENADHSMETGNVAADLSIQSRIMKECAGYLKEIGVQLS